MTTQKITSKEAYTWIVEIGPSKSLEKIVAQSKYYSYMYAKDVLKGRFKLGENQIAKSSVYVYLYARHVIKGRWPEGEPKLMKDPYWALWYAIDVIKNRWPEAEPAIQKYDGSGHFTDKNPDGTRMTWWERYCNKLSVETPE